MLLFPNQKIEFDVPDASVIYYPEFFSVAESDQLFRSLRAETHWQADTITIFGKTYDQPRLTALYGDAGKPYSYSGIKMFPNDWSDLLRQIKNKVETVAHEKFTTVLLNLYRDGRDSNGWHADNEKELGINPIIASVSFGATRVFQMRHNSIANAKLSITLEHGSLLLMKGTTQHFWKHQIPKTTKPIDERINLTFRIIK